MWFFDVLKTKIGIIPISAIKTASGVLNFAFKMILQNVLLLFPNI